MNSVPLTSPAFGQATLADCEREQIHLAGSIQPHGVLLVVQEPDYVIIQTSANAVDVLKTGPIIGRPLSELEGNLLLQILPHLSGPLHSKPMTVRCSSGSPLQRFDCTFHRPSHGGLIIELEPVGSSANPTPALDDAFHRIASDLGHTAPTHEARPCLAATFSGVLRFRTSAFVGVHSHTN